MNRRMFLRRAAVVPLVAALPAIAAVAALTPKPEPQAYATASVDGEIKVTLNLDPFIPADGAWHHVSTEMALARSKPNEAASVNMDYLHVLGSLK